MRVRLLVFFVIWAAAFGGLFGPSWTRLPSVLLLAVLAFFGGIVFCESWAAWRRGMRLPGAPLAGRSPADIAHAGRSARASVGRKGVRR